MQVLCVLLVVIARCGHPDSVARSLAKGKENTVQKHKWRETNEQANKQHTQTHTQKKEEKKRKESEIKKEVVCWFFVVEMDSLGSFRLCTVKRCQPVKKTATV